VYKETGETHETDLTIFSCKSRVFCSPSMARQINVNSVLQNSSSEARDWDHG